MSTESASGPGALTSQSRAFSYAYALCMLFCIACASPLRALPFRIIGFYCGYPTGCVKVRIWSSPSPSASARASLSTFPSTTVASPSDAARR
jgi:uncharacterized membrane protein YjjB (DUF3815 family)